MNCRFSRQQIGTTFFFLSFCTAPFLCSCGLEEYQVLDPPILMRLAGGTDPYLRYFDFRTVESGEYNDAAIFQGTTVYYKIYASDATMQSEISSISTANTQYSSNGYNRMVQLGYLELNADARNSLLIPRAGSGRQVVIRLFDEASYTARVHGNDTDIEVSPVWGRPLRRLNDKGFNFFADTEAERENNPVPVSGDGDVNYTGYSDGKSWYVNAYAVSVGQNDLLVNLYSQLLHLGFIIISE
ncbi:MAG: hypothetical protein LBS97_03770 [Treponema sp.]|jgi:hypothetical protein|nr:hypothetical protein [Treponema sp.]